jgi:hypothetical protein
MQNYIRLNRLQLVLEKKGELKKLVGKEEDEELTINDAKRLGVKIANMEGENRRKYVGIMNFLGASCGIYNSMWKNYKRTKKKQERSKK